MQLRSHHNAAQTSLGAARAGSRRWLHSASGVVLVSGFLSLPVVPNEVTPTGRPWVGAVADSVEGPAPEFDDAIDASAAARIDMVVEVEHEVASPNVEWALTRFEVAGLEAPSAAIEFPADGCNGHPGRYLPSQRLVELCVSDDAPNLSVRQLVLHELAHAWAHEFLTEKDREEFTDLRELSAWNDVELDWHERATEHAAETIAWGLLDVDFDLTHTIGAEDPDSLRTAFVALTGVEPINGGDHPSDDPTVAPVVPQVVRL